MGSQLEYDGAGLGIMPMLLLMRAVDSVVQCVWNGGFLPLIFFFWKLGTSRLPLCSVCSFTFLALSRTKYEDEEEDDDDGLQKSATSCVSWHTVLLSYPGRQPPWSVPHFLLIFFLSSSSPFTFLLCLLCFCCTDEKDHHARLTQLVGRE